MPNRVLIRPDGTRLTLPEGPDAEKLRSLGYRDESGGEQLDRDIGAGYEEHYTTPGQKLLTAAEGLASGVTLGASDLLLDGEGTRDRARYNPGTRIASELVGAIAMPGIGEIGAVAKVAKYLPSVALARGAAKAGQVAGRGSRVVGGLVSGAVEGAGVGAGMAVTTAQLNGDPITAESIVAGMGWGAVWGGGIAALGGGIAGRMEARAAKKAEAEAIAASRLSKSEIIAEEGLTRAKGKAQVHTFVKEGLEENHAMAKALEDANFTHVREAMVDATTQIKAAGKVADDAMLDFKKLNHSQTKIYNALVNEPALFKMAKADAKAFQEHYALAKAAADAGDFKKMNHHLTKFKDRMIAAEQKLGGAFSAEKVVGQADELMGHAKLRVENAAKAAEDATQVEAIKSVLTKFPKTADEFITLKPKSIEELSAAVDSFGKVRSAEFAGIQVAIKDAITALSTNMGVKIEGTAGQQLQGMWKIIKEGRTARGKEMLEMAQDGKRIWEKVGQKEEGLLDARVRREFDKAEEVRRADGKTRGPWAARYLAGSWAANKMGPVGYVLGSSLVSGLVGLKGAILGTIAEKANKWVPRAARGMEKRSARVEPFLKRLDGTIDESDRREKLLQRRAKEITEAAPTVRDTLYRAVEPLAIEHPELAASMHAHGIQRFQFMLGKLPKDPGMAFSNLKSIWKPDPVAMEKFARYYEVFHDPVAVMTRALETGKITMEAADGLKNMNPEMFAYLRAQMLYRVSDPEVISKMKYADQVHLGMLLDIPMHSTMDPRFIAAQQQMFTERNQPLEMNPRIQPGGGAGRPSGPGPSATAAQRATEH
jgi:hypothetical protein